MAENLNHHRLAFLLILLMRRRYRHLRVACRTTWSKTWIQKRQKRAGVYHTVCGRHIVFIMRQKFIFLLAFTPVYAGPESRGHDIEFGGLRSYLLLP